jgi:allantoate deiminase
MHHARDEACRHLHQQVAEIGERRGTATDWRPVQEHRTVPCAPQLTRPFEEAIAAQGYSVVALPSGAGHDAAVLAALTGVAMLFVRCRGGISHHPDESVTVEDVAVALDVLRRFFTLLGQDQLMRAWTVVTAKE